MHWRDCPCSNCELKRAVRAHHAVQAREMKAKGISIAKIAIELGSNATAISKLLKEPRSHTQ